MGRGQSRGNGQERKQQWAPKQSLKEDNWLDSTGEIKRECELSFRMSSGETRWNIYKPQLQVKLAQGEDRCSKFPYMPKQGEADKFWQPEGYLPTMTRVLANGNASILKARNEEGVEGDTGGTLALI